MRIKLVTLPFIFGLSLALAILWLIGHQARSVTAAATSELHVCPSGCPYDNVQEAVDAASEGDLIKIAAGTYTGVSTRQGITQVVYLSKTLTLQGGYTPSDWTTPDPEVNLTTLDAQGQGRVLYLNVDGIPTIAGLHITGGDATDQGYGEVGGGIFAKIKMQIAPHDTQITDNHIYNNTAYDGGGVYLDQGNGFILTGNTIVSNTAVRNGGGVMVQAADVILNNNTFVGNTAFMGGGLVVDYCDALLQGNTFYENSAIEAGGGLFVQNSAIKADTEKIMYNHAGRGGGLAIFGTFNKYPWQENWMINTLVAGNVASVEGAGLYIGGSSVHLWHTTLSDNTGGWDSGSGVIIGDWYTGQTSEVELFNTIVSTQTVGIKVENGSTVKVDSLLWFNTPLTITQVPGADVSVIHEFTGDPDFLDPDTGDYHLGAVSAARDTGLVTGTPTDLDGMVRPMGFGYDLGAYEFHDAALSLHKTPNLSGANVGEELTYSIVLTSSGEQDTNNVVLTDTLDTWQRATMVDSVNGNCTIEDPNWGGTVVCNPGNLNIGDVIHIELTVEVSGTAPMGEAMTNTLQARADEAAHTLQTTVYAQDCHVRIGESAQTYSSVQEAVDAAYPYALVKVAGTCMGVYGPEGWRQQVYLDQVLTLQGGYTPENWTTPDPEANLTTLDARGLGRVLFIYTQTAGGTTIDGFHLTGGNAYGQTGGHEPIQRNESRGGGVYVFGSDPTFLNNHIFGNTAPGPGGGMYTSFCNCTLHSNTFTANTTLEDGGGLAVHAGGAELSDNYFEGNSARNGGGFAAAAAGGGNFTRDIFIGNHATGFGGGLALETAAQLNETLILSNTAERGGGIGFFENINPWNPYAILTNTVIANNQANLEGAGVYIPSGGAVHMLHVTLARNTGGDGSGVTLSGNESLASTLFMTNTLLAYQNAGLRVSDASTVTVNGVLWFAIPDNVIQSDQATVYLSNEHTGDPAFLDLDGNDYHIGELSAARNVGAPSGVFWDLDREPRPMGGAWDLGADEYFETRVYLPLVVR
jgi:uncharacterized repeat protein (TIGR01451 family)